VARSRRSRPDALAAALRYLAPRARSIDEVRTRLSEKGYGGSEIDTALEHLAVAGYLDDERYASALAEERMRLKHWGPARIRADLLRRGVGAGIIEGVVASIDVDVESAVADGALKSWLRRNAVSPPLDQRTRALAYRHLTARGFSVHVVMKTLGRFEADDPE